MKNGAVSWPVQQTESSFWRKNRRGHLKLLPPSITQISLNSNLCSCVRNTGFFSMTARIWVHQDALLHYTAKQECRVAFLQIVTEIKKNCHWFYFLSHHLKRIIFTSNCCFKLTSSISGSIPAIPQKIHGRISELVHKKSTAVLDLDLVFVIAAFP